MPSMDSKVCTEHSVVFYFPKAPLTTQLTTHPGQPIIPVKKYTLYRHKDTVVEEVDMFCSYLRDIQYRSQFTEVFEYVLADAVYGKFTPSPDTPSYELATATRLRHIGQFLRKLFDGVDDFFNSPFLAYTISDFVEEIMHGLGVEFEKRQRKEQYMGVLLDMPTYLVRYSNPRYSFARFAFEYDPFGIIRLHLHRDAPEYATIIARHADGGSAMAYFKHDTENEWTYLGDESFYDKEYQGH